MDYGDVYRPVLNQRLFARDTLYSSIDWNSFRHVVASHKIQLSDWYIDACQTLLENGHHSFGVVALTSMLVDCLSQYQAGAIESGKREFKNFLHANIPRSADQFPAPIDAVFRSQSFQITCAADALYNGLRCGILHEAHPTLYTAITGDQNEIFVYHQTGLATYADGRPCPVVTVHPQRYFDRIYEVARDYWKNLINPDPAYDDLRLKFKTKFESAFGVSINTSL